MKGGDKPHPPRCALASMIESGHDVTAIKADLFYRQRHLWVELDDPELSPDLRNAARWLGLQLYPRHSQEKK